MASKQDVKRLIKATCEFMNTVGSIVDLDADAGEGLKNELAMFLMYLSASDGEISWEEASSIGELCDINLTPQKMSNFIKEHNVYSVEFENKPPISLQLLVLVENKLYESNLLDEVPDGCEMLIETYKNVAQLHMESDGYVSSSEKVDYKIYIEMMERYANQNSLRRKKTISGFTKNAGKITAPTKSGVSAPKKG